MQILSIDPPAYENHASIAVAVCCCSPPPRASLPGAATPETPEAGKFLVLRNGRTMEGDIQLVDDQYRVRRNGGETLIPTNWCCVCSATPKRRTSSCAARPDLNDPDERLRSGTVVPRLRSTRGRPRKKRRSATVLRPNQRRRNNCWNASGKCLTPAAPNRPDPTVSPAESRTLRSASRGRTDARGARAIHAQGAADPDERLRLVPCPRRPRRFLQAHESPRPADTRIAGRQRRIWPRCLGRSIMCSPP